MVTVKNIVGLEKGPYISNIAVQVFTANGTYTPNPYLVYAVVEVWGGGGASSTSLQAASACAGAGGAGAYSVSVLSASTIGSSQAVTIGSGGSQPANIAGSAGGSGGTTSFGSLISCSGGTGSNSSESNWIRYYSTANGASAGSGGNWLNLSGGNPTPAAVFQSNWGAPGMWGMGGPARINPVPSLPTTTPSSSYAIGASGGIGNASVFERGQPGAGGAIIVTEFCYA